MVYHVILIINQMVVSKLKYNEDHEPKIYISNVDLLRLFKNKKSAQHI